MVTVLIPQNYLISSAQPFLPISFPVSPFCLSQLVSNLKYGGEGYLSNCGDEMGWDRWHGNFHQRHRDIERETEREREQSRAEQSKEMNFSYAVKIQCENCKFLRLLSESSSCNHGYGVDQRAENYRSLVPCKRRGTGKGTAYMSVSACMVFAFYLPQFLD